MPLCRSRDPLEDAGNEVDVAFAVNVVGLHAITDQALELGLELDLDLIEQVRSPPECSRSKQREEPPAEGPGPVGQQRNAAERTDRASGGQSEVKPEAQAGTGARAGFEGVLIEGSRDRETGARDDSLAVSLDDREGCASGDAQIIGVHHKGSRHQSKPEIIRGPIILVRKSGSLCHRRIGIRYRGFQ